MKDNVRILTILLNNGADPKIKNKNGRLPKLLIADREIKAILKPKNIQKIQNERKLKQLESTSGDEFSQTLSMQNSDTVISESLPSVDIDESYIGKITEIETGIMYICIVLRSFGCSDFACYVVNNDDEEEGAECSNERTKNDFAIRVGVELHEIVYFFQHLPDKSQFWHKTIGKHKEKITRSKQLYKLTYALIYATVKMKHNKRVTRGELRKEDGTVDPAQKPPSDIVKELTRILKSKIIHYSALLNYFINDCLSMKNKLLIIV